MRTVLGFVVGLSHACCRYRLQAYAPQLKVAGWEVEPCAIPRSIVPRLKALRRAEGAHAVLLQRKLLDRFQLAWLRRRSRWLIFDFDDAIFQRDSFAAGGGDSRRRRERFRRAVLNADVVSASNDYLAERARELSGPARVVVIPTCIDPTGYPLPEKTAPPVSRAAAGLEMVWIGSASTARALEQAANLLELIGRSVPGARLKVICDRFPRFSHLPVKPVAWSSATEAAELAAADVGISVLPDDDWSRGKCGLKVLQYMAAGLPVVASAVGVHGAMVERGRSGFLAGKAEEWIDALRALAADPELARSMGRRGRKIVEERYSIAVWAPALQRVLPQG